MIPKPEPLSRVRSRKRRQRAAARVAMHNAVVTGPCVACSRPATAVHHVIPRSLGGPDTPENGVQVCAWHHNDIHAKLLTLKRVNGQWQVSRVYGRTA